MHVIRDRLQLWNRYSATRYNDAGLEVSLDVSRIGFDEGYWSKMAPAISSAMDAMAGLEAGVLANRDEGRMVGHYWLRAPEMAPTDALAGRISECVGSVASFAERVHSGMARGAGGPFEDVVHIGIGGSCLGPQLLCDALASANDEVAVHFLDNADPDGIDRLLNRLRGDLGRTLVSVVSKSGITPTPRYVAGEIEKRYARLGLRFQGHAVATTIAGSELDLRAREERWLANFPLWDWVGGRTSVTSAVGLLPAALQGVKIDDFLDGAAAMDRRTRCRDASQNPAMLLALTWYWLGNGQGRMNMVILPYRDRLALFARYVQQLVMESIGKKFDRSGKAVHQGLTVFGNKGSTDQHAYFQQLREGAADSFVTFIVAHRDQRAAAPEIETGVTLGDYLFANAEGTRNALQERGRPSITIGLADLGARSLGALIALYERAIGFYAELIDVNAYHQPGVDKNPAEPVIGLLRAVVAQIRACTGPQTASEVADAIGRPDHVETVYKLLEHLAMTLGRGVTMERGRTPSHDRFSPSDDSDCGAEHATGY